MKVGYARVSTVKQDLELQRAKLAKLGVSDRDVYVDHGFSGKTMSRNGIEQALAACRDGDELVVPTLDRLARNTLEVLKLTGQLSERGIRLNVGGSIYDPHDVMGKLYFTILAAVHEAEGAWISIRTQEAMQRPDVRARLKGKKPTLSPRQDALVLRQFEEEKIPVHELAGSHRISRASIYRALDRARDARDTPAVQTPDSAARA